jgi:rare lipoprotein A
MLRKSRPVQLGVGALMLAIPASAVALAGGQAESQSATQINLNLNPSHVAYGRDVTVSGTASPGAAGHKLRLEFAATGAGNWRVLRSTSVRSNGRFQFVVALQKSGFVRVVGAAGAGGTGGAFSPRVLIGGSGSGAIAPSPSRPVSVAAGFRLPTPAMDVLAGQTVHVRGRLLPAVAGRRVRLVSRASGRWRTLATARTGRTGGFVLRYTAGSTGQQWLHVRFVGDRLNTRSWARAGRLRVFRQSVASWYSDGGGTACGFHAYFGVANKDVPCGTKVTFRYGGHSVTSVVDDRGPYVGGREWDLNQNTAGALGFGGVDTVWSSH